MPTSPARCTGQGATARRPFGAGCCRSGCAAGAPFSQLAGLRTRVCRWCYGAADGHQRRLPAYPSCHRFSRSHCLSVADCSPSSCSCCSLRRRACRNAVRNFARGEAGTGLDSQRQPYPTGVIGRSCKHRQVLQVFGTLGFWPALVHAFGVGIGWLLGGPDVDTRRVMALGAGQRNIAAALVVASQSFDDPKVVVMVIVVAIVGLIVLMPLSRALAKSGFAQHY